MPGTRQTGARRAVDVHASRRVGVHPAVLARVAHHVTVEVRMRADLLAVAEPEGRTVDESAQVHLRYATKFPEITRRHLQDRGIVADAVLLRKIGLPPVVANAIQEKLKREQEAEQMKFVLLCDTTVGQEALLRFYVLHVAVLPAVLVLLIAIHFWRIRKDGGISGPL